MKVIKRGDKYAPNNGEVIGLVVGGKTYVCRVLIGFPYINTDPSFLVQRGLCTGCPLDENLCEHWLVMEDPHRVIEVEEDIE